MRCKVQWRVVSGEWKVFLVFTRHSPLIPHHLVLL
jgi:hypothetical protein